MQRIELDALLDYARCPLLYWWRHRARVVPPPTAEALPEQAVRRGLRRYYRGRATSVLEGVLAVWREWLDEWGCPPGTMEGLRRYAEVESMLLTPFLDGSIRRDDGTPYQAPRMTRHYWEQARAAGLPKMAQELRRAMREAPIVVAGEYDLVTAFSDAVLMALRYGGPERDPYGSVRTDAPFELAITDGITMVGRADLVVVRGEQVVVAEVHDYGSHRPPAPAVSRHLQVVALAHAEGEEWGKRPAVVYRHMRSGTSVEVQQADSCDRLLPIVAAALRGVQCGVFLPRLAVAERGCLSCAYYGLCVTEEGLDVLDDLDATLLATGRTGRQK